MSEESWWRRFFLSGDYTLLEEIPPERTEAQVAFLQEKLDLSPGLRVLDVACGIGRHSRRLAGLGLEVIGLDYTPAYLRRAVEGLEATPARFVNGDMRRLPFAAGSFDVALNLFTSFGYFDSDEQDLQALKEMARVLEPGGVLLLDIQNRDGIARRLQERDWSLIEGGRLLEQRRWEIKTGRIVSAWTFVRGGEERNYLVSTRVYTYTEIARMLREAGLEIIDVWGDWDGGELALESRRIILKAARRQYTAV